MKKPDKKRGEIRKPAKTLAGVTPIAVMLPPRKCKHGTCVYCPSLQVPQSYTPLSPAVMRARLLNYSPYKQVLARLKAFKKMNHPTEKIELIIMGGTFLEYPKKFQEKFVKNCYGAMNNKISKNLEEAKKINETAKSRCVALCIETRPDVCSDKHIKNILEFGCTRVELGVQMPDDKIYKLTKRGHKVKDVVDAVDRLKNAGFKVGFHIMPGLPSSSPRKDLQMFKKIFTNSNFKPDQIKIYPCQVIKGSELEELYYKKKYKPYSLEKLKKLLTNMILEIPEYCRIMRVMREIPPVYLVAGTTRIDLRKEIEDVLRSQNKKIKEIRLREIGFSKTKNFDLELKTLRYEASGGREYFIQIVNKENILFALLRLRLNKESAIVRELHVYGKSTKLGKKGKTQHIGLGKQLMKKAEEITRKHDFKKLSIISGVGVREYYKKLGYKLEGSYMVKRLF